jgi:hypothetical protein
MAWGLLQAQCFTGVHAVLLRRMSRCYCQLYTLPDTSAALPLKGFRVVGTGKGHLHMQWLLLPSCWPGWCSGVATDCAAASRPMIESMP